MARLKGPLFSEKAQKQLGHKLIYKRRGKKNLLTKYSKPGSVTPFTPSAGQEEKRNWYGAAVGAWRALSPAEKKVYNDRAKGKSYSGWNLFLKEFTIGWVVDGKDYFTRRLLTIDAAKIDSDLVNFPVLAKLQTFPSIDFNKFNDDGFDVRFTKYDGETLLKYERERHDKAGGKGEYWVKIPEVKSTADNKNKFYNYYRTEDTNDGADPTAVWDSYYKAVYHLKGSYDGTPNEVKDSTANGKHGKGGAGVCPAQEESKIGKGQHFDGVNDVIELPSVILGNPTELTLEIWFKSDVSSGTHQRIFVINDDADNVFFNMQIPLNEAANMIRFWCKNSGVEASDTTTAYTITNWHLLVGRAKENDYLDLFVDGNKIGTSNACGVFADHGSQFGKYIGSGRLGSGNVPADGVIDETRISNVKRTDAWIKASYNSGNDSLLTYGNEET